MLTDDQLRTLVASAAPERVSHRDELDEAWAAVVARASAKSAVPSRRLGPPQVTPRRLATVAAIAALLIAAVVVPLTLRSGASPRSARLSPSAVPFEKGPFVDTAATPAGWVPVAFGNAQISVPPSWMLESPQETGCSPNATGAVFLGELPSPISPDRCTLPANLVSMVAAPPSHAASTSTSTSTSVSAGGASLYRYRVAYGVEVSASGPLAHKVLATLTRSPRSVALGRFGVQAPESWKQVSLGGMSLRVPATWRVSRSPYAGCAPSLERHVAILASASTNAFASCPAGSVTAGAEAGLEGVMVVAGRYLLLPTATGRCLPLDGLSACLDPKGQTGSVLSLAVQLPGKARPVSVKIGLAGSGATDRAILDSIRPVTTTTTTLPPADFAAACRPDQLRLTAGSYGVAGGSFSETLVFTDASTAPCSLRGWPSVAESGANGSFKTASTRVRQTVPPAAASSLVGLYPGATASFDLYGADWNAVANRACPTTTRIVVTLASGGPSLSVPLHIPACGGAFIAPVVAGSHDRQWWARVMPPST